MNTLSLHCLQGKLMSFGIFCAQALFDYSEKQHKRLVPQAAQISQKHICLKIRNDWRVQGNGRDDGKIYPATYWKTSWPWAYKQQKPSQGKGREHVLSDMRADSVLAAKDTNVTAVSQVTAPPLLPQGLHSALHLRWEENLQLTGCHSDGRCTNITCLLQWAPLGMALAPKNYFCAVSQRCSSFLTLRLLFLLTVLWTSSSCGHLCLGSLGLSKSQHNTADETSLGPFKHCHTSETIVHCQRAHLCWYLPNLSLFYWLYMTFISLRKFIANEIVTVGRLQGWPTQ